MTVPFIDAIDFYGSPDVLPSFSNGESAENAAGSSPNHGARSISFSLNGKFQWQGEGGQMTLCDGRFKRKFYGWVVTDNGNFRGKVTVTSFMDALACAISFLPQYCPSSS